MKAYIIVAFLLGAIGVANGHDIDHHHGLQPGDKDYRHETYHELYQRFWLHVNGIELTPGDEQYMSEEYGSTYKKLYRSGKCACKSGYCRPTKWRPTELGASTGYDILVNRQWMPVPEGALHNEKSLPPELWSELMSGAEAHACAYPDSRVANFGQRIECAIVPDMVGWFQK